MHSKKDMKSWFWDYIVNYLTLKRRFIMLTALFFVLFLSLSSNLLSQPESFYFVSIDKQKGLPDNSIYHVYQDNKGFIWLCTGNGLVRFDGNNFKKFSKENNNDGKHVNSIRVSHIMQDNSGLFWISTSDRGINVYNPEYASFSYFEHDVKDTKSLGNNNTYTCFQDSKGQIWVSTLGDGLDLYEPTTKSFIHFRNSETNPNSIPNNHVTAIIEDAYGKLWVATEGNNLCEFDPLTKKFTRYKTSFEGNNMGGYFKKLYFSDKHTLWIATDGNGLLKFDIKTHLFTRYYQDYKPGSINSNNLKGLISDNAGNMLIISDGGGINSLDLNKEKFKYITYDYNQRNGITTNALYSIIADKDKNIWVGTYKAGLLLLKENTRTISIVSQNTGNSGLCHKSVLCIHKDKEGITWYGTDGGGLSCYNPKTGKFSCYQFNPRDPNSLSSNVVKDIHEDKNGNLWIATFFGGLNKYNKKTKQFERYQYTTNTTNGISSNNSWCIMEDRDENLWIGNFSRGLDRYNTKTKTFTLVPQNYTDSTTLSHVQVSSLVQDVKGYIWVGTLFGLNQMDPKTLKCKRFIHNPSDSNSLSDNLITCLYYDSKHRLWIGTDQGGLNLMVKPGIFKSYGQNVLPSNAIQSIQEDKNGNIWASTKNGLVTFNPSTETFYNMDDVDDLISNEFNWNSSARDADGELYFGSIDGACIFNPADIKFSKPFPTLVFTDVKAFNKPLEVGESYHGHILLKKSVTYGGKVTLTAKENTFTIDFTAIEFNKPNKIKYKYKLKGFDKNWIYTDALQRNATYTNLSGGNYTFLLSSTNSAGIWNKDINSLNITIIPPFYKQWWFKLLISMVLALVIFALYRRNIEKHRRIVREEALKREKELIERRNSELKSEIASNTILLLNKNESLEQIKGKLEELKPHTENQGKISELIHMVDFQMEADVYWEQFQYNFDQVYMNLLTRLKEKYPDLTRTNLKLCAYLRLNMSSKEIASLMNITISGIDKARNRLRKKLNIQPNDDLSDFLINF
jgi:ligand-binding sensor domain-containing protein/DNA-binding CsgD family transcriptional regulator